MTDEQIFRTLDVLNGAGKIHQATVVVSHQFNLTLECAAAVVDKWHSQSVREVQNDRT